MSVFDMLIKIEDQARDLAAARARIAELGAERDRLAAALTEFYDRRTTGYERDQAFVEAGAALKEWEKKRTP